MAQDSLVRWLADLGNSDLPIGGGKNASLGDLIRPRQEGMRVPDGFATSHA